MPDTPERRRPSRQGRERFFIEGAGMVGDPDTAPATAPVTDGARAAAAATAADFRFSRLGPKGTKLPEGLLRKVAAAMAANDDGGNGTIPAGDTYLGQFVDHDLTFDQTVASTWTASPASAPATRPRPSSTATTRTSRSARRCGPGLGRLQARREYDLPRVGDGSDDDNVRRALIPGFRNDENLAVAQTHLAFARFHHRVVDGP